MTKTLAIQVRAHRKKIPAAAARVFAHLEEYDWILFTSKHAVIFFSKELRERSVALPKMPRVAAVGPVTAATLRSLKYKVTMVPEFATVNSLIKKLGRVKGKRLLFPRSDIAPYDAVRTLRARGGRVTVLSLYTTKAVPLSKTAKHGLLHGAYARLAFKSPSGVRGLMGQLTPQERRLVRVVPAACIGPTTALAARAAGFKKILL